MCKVSFPSLTSERTSLTCAFNVPFVDNVYSIWTLILHRRRNHSRRCVERIARSRQLKRKRRRAKIAEDCAEHRVEKLFVERDNSSARRVATRIRSLNSYAGQRLRPRCAQDKEHERDT